MGRTMERRLTRRTFLQRGAALSAATWGASVWAPGVAQARARTMAMSASPDGTTLASAFGPAGDGAYVKLVETPGWPTLVRELNTQAATGRDVTRRAIASIVHLTDVHVVDAQSPARVEWLDRDADPPQGSVPFDSAHWAQEMLCTQISEAMNRAVRAVGGGPITGRAYDACVSTGDNIDNQQANELAWFMQLLDGGSQLTPNSGDLTRYEGVQDDDPTTYDLHYWHPEETGNIQGPDRYKTLFGFPSMPGFFESAITPFQTTGIGVRWYSCYGNHDGLLQGNMPANPVLEGIATGPVKVFNRPAGVTGADIIDGIQAQDPNALAAAFAGPGRPVTADPQRSTVSVRSWIQAHLDSPSAPGPSGHGYTQDALDSLVLYYTFEIAEGVLGICLDTVNRGGYADGSIGAAQLAWLESQLVAHSRRYVDAGGTVVEHDVTDHLVLLFSHHNLRTLNNPFPDPAIPEQRAQGPAVEELLHRFGNVVAWVNGHSHVNRVTPYPDPTSQTSGFWEISTAAHIDFPQQSRLIELVDNADGTLSIFGTLVDHAGPASAELSSDVLALASIARELGVNDPQRGVTAGLGEPEDRNVELVLPVPFDLSDVGAPVTGNATGTGDGGRDDDTGSLAATGGGALGVAAIALASAVALRARGGTERSEVTTPTAE